MRLLHVTTFELREFLGDELPIYSILSHTWAEEEVSYKDFMSGTYHNLTGWNKIHECCRASAREGYEWTWVDTCCIDKSSSSELSEAINSMFEWYAKSSVCYAYLSDVHDPLGSPGLEPSFRQSRWFTRGWTLQELVAPAVVVFFNSSWQEIGTSFTLHEWICTVTKIDKGILGPFRRYRARQEPISEALAGLSVAKKMSWASDRTTTRLEDRAYCLMGLFGVNMPLLYGEGNKAFYRLQRQIMEQSNDPSIFVWRTDIYSYGGPTQVLLASSPDLFRHCHDVEMYPFTKRNASLGSLLHSYEVYKNAVRLAILDMGIVSQQSAYEQSLFRCSSVRHGDLSLAEALQFRSRTVRGALPRSHIAMLECRNTDGRIGILVKDNADGLVQRSWCHAILTCEDENFEDKNFNRGLPALTQIQIQFMGKPEGLAANPTTAELVLTFSSTLCSYFDTDFPVSENLSSQDCVQLKWELGLETFVLKRTGCYLFRSKDFAKLASFLLTYAWDWQNSTAWATCNVVSQTFKTGDAENERIRQQEGDPSISDVRCDLGSQLQVVVKIRVHASSCRFSVFLDSALV